MKNGPHILVCSDYGTGKSTFASTVIQSRNPRPVLIQAFDPADKLTPYRRKGTVVREEWQYGVRELIQRDGNTIAVIEHWVERDGVSPSVTAKGGTRVKTDKYTQPGRMYERYLERMQGFFEEVNDYYAFILDSTTALELSVRTYLVGVMHVSDNRIFYNQATNELERFMCRVLPNLPISTIIISHSSLEIVGNDEDKHATGRNVIRLPGRLHTDPFGTFGEVYRAYTETTKNGKESIESFGLQTRKEKNYPGLGSQLGVPNPMEPHWKHVVAACKKIGMEVE